MQAQKLDYELAHINIHFYEMLEHVRRPDLQLQSYKISMTQGNNKIFEKRPSEVPVSIV